MKNKEEIIDEYLNKDVNKLNNFAYIVNNDKPFFEKEDFEIIEGIPLDNGYSACKLCNK